LLLPAVAAHASPSLSPISDQTVNANHPLTANVVAVDPDGGEITLTATLPTFGTLNDPKTGTGSVSTTFTLSPVDGDVGAHSGSVTATVGQLTDTEEFQITVGTADANQPPRVTAPALVTGTEGTLLNFDVTAADADADPITALTATGLPDGASFTPNGTYTSGSFSWTPGLQQAGHYDVVFAASNAQSDSTATHITVGQSDLGPPTFLPIDDLAVAEGDSVNLAVSAIDPDLEEVSLTASLPTFATLNAPTGSSGTDTLHTSITVEPEAGDAGTYPSSVTATSRGESTTEEFTITVTGPPATNMEATATLIGAFNHHKKFICFKVKPAVENGFDLLLVDLASITLKYKGGSIPAIHPTHLAFDCDDEDDQGEDHDGDIDDDHDGDGDRGDESCRACDNDRDGHDSDDDPEDEDCDPSHVMACFSMDALETLFGEDALPDSLVAATIEGSLTTGETFVATIGGKHIAKGDPSRHGKLALRVRPNPMNPKADITFTLAQPTRVRVAIYDLGGRLLSTVYEGSLAAGPQSVAWNGSTRTGNRVASGVYFVSVETSQVTEVQRVTVLK
jgi:hypothetical protein